MFSFIKSIGSDSASLQATPEKSEISLPDHLRQPHKN
jgi:hypothetical protein